MVIPESIFTPSDATLADLGRRMIRDLERFLANELRRPAGERRYVALRPADPARNPTGDAVYSPRLSGQQNGRKEAPSC
jgi:hypothetical protein